MVSPTEDIGKILASFANVTLGGAANVSTAVQIAQLALKHRKNKAGAQRIIVFVGSPVTEDVAVLTQIGKQLKKNNVALDVVSMGEGEANIEILTEFVNAANSNDNRSTYLHIPLYLLYQLLYFRESPLIFLCLLRQSFHLCASRRAPTRCRQLVAYDAQCRQLRWWHGWRRRWRRRRGWRVR
jgi:hypothetical protein